MRNLSALFVTAAMALNTTAIAQAPPGSLWYNGDWNEKNGLANERNTVVTQAAVYDDFNVADPMGWHVTAVFSDNIFVNMTVTGADWEIRTGISEGNAGTLIASGTTNSPIVTQTDQCSINFCANQVEVTGLNVSLPMLPSGQHYWLNVTPVGNGSGRSFNTTTSGTNCVGTPCGNDGNAFFNSTYFGVFFGPAGNQIGGNPDFSNGVIGTVFPNQQRQRCSPVEWEHCSSLCVVGARPKQPLNVDLDCRDKGVGARIFFTAPENLQRARAFRSQCLLRRKRESQRNVGGYGISHSQSRC